MAKFNNCFTYQILISLVISPMVKIKISGMQDDVAFLDWRNWTFCDDTSTNAIHGLENTSLSVYEGSAGSLHIDNLPIILHPCDASTLQNEVPLDQHLSKKEHSPELVCTASFTLIHQLFLLIALYP
jgi:hypothetical protein